MNDKPKELKEHSAHIFELGCMERSVYLKEDVDAVIAELQGRLDDCLTELAQVAAVSMRCMFFVMGKKPEKESHG